MTYRIQVQRRPERYRKLEKPKRKWGVKSVKLKLPPFLEVELTKAPKEPARLRA